MAEGIIHAAPGPRSARVTHEDQVAADQQRDEDGVYDLASRRSRRARPPRAVESGAAPATPSSPPQSWPKKTRYSDFRKRSSARSSTAPGSISTSAVTEAICSS